MKSCFHLSISFSLLLATFLVAAPAPAVRAQQAVVEPTPTPPIPADATLEQLMTPEEFRAAGLKKLSGAEMAKLNDFLRGMRAQTEKAATEKVEPPPSPHRGTSNALIESEIVGNFDGLKGRTRWLLTNGQVWQQANSGDHFSAHAEKPGVALIRSTFGYKMVVNGIAKPFYVKQIIIP